MYDKYLKEMDNRELWIEKEFLQRFDDKQLRNVDYVLTEKYNNELK